MAIAVEYIGASQLLRGTCPGCHPKSTPMTHLSLCEDIKSKRIHSLPFAGSIVNQDMLQGDDTDNMEYCRGGVIVGFQVKLLLAST